MKELGYRQKIIISILLKLLQLDVVHKLSQPGGGEGDFIIFSFFGIFGQSSLFLSDKEGERLFRLMSYVSDPFVLQF